MNGKSSPFLSRKVAMYLPSIMSQIMMIETGGVSRRTLLEVDAEIFANSLSETSPSLKMEKRNSENEQCESEFFHTMRFVVG